MPDLRQHDFARHERDTGFYSDFDLIGKAAVIVGLFLLAAVLSHLFGGG